MAEIHRPYDEVLEELCTVIKEKNEEKWLRDTTLILLLFITGARISEILGLTKARFTFPSNEADDMVKIIISTEKNKKQKERTLELVYAQSAPAWEIIKKRVYGLPKPDSLVVGLGRNMAYKLVKFYLGQNYYPHWFRHYLASRSAQRYPAHILMQRFGWSHFNSAAPYLHMDGAAAFRIDKELFEEDLRRKRVVVQAPEIIVEEEKELVF